MLDDMKLRRKSEDTNIYWSFAVLTLSSYLTDHCSGAPQRSSDLPKFTGAGRWWSPWENIQPLLFSLSQAVSRGCCLHLYTDCGERDLLNCIEKNPRPEFKGNPLVDLPGHLLFGLCKSASWEAQLSPFLWATSSLNGSPPALPICWDYFPVINSYFMFLPIVLPRTFVVLLPTFCEPLTFMLLKGACVCGLLLCSSTVLWSGA